MAMLRVSSYRRLFEEETWGRSGGLSSPCAGQYQASVRRAAADKCDCDCEQLDFVAAKSLNKEGLTRFALDRSVIAALNDRLVGLIELARCFEEENDSLECQIVELEEKQSSRPAASSSITSAVAPPDFSLDAVVERLRRERDEILCDTEELHKELERLQSSYEELAQQRVFYLQEQQDVAEVVDAVTAECLALREQVAIYEEQLANMEARHKTEVESLQDPADWTTGAAAALGFCSPDMTPVLDVKEFYCQLAESLQFGAASSAAVRGGDRKQLEVGAAEGSKVTDSPKIQDVGELKMLISELQKEIVELEKYNEELEDEVEMKTSAHMDEIADLKFTMDEMRQQEADFQVQMKEQCEDYKELLSEKMARDMEIVAYRSLLEDEEERLCDL
ncbi:peripherin [Limanda limanda]|uniref:peripherin n=1 Tax=Limanda limanda TaxID=27771 RepID=UPI0029C66B4A|nr:peripherin [Limanda limanda]